MGADRHGHGEGLGDGIQVGGEELRLLAALCAAALLAAPGLARADGSSWEYWPEVQATTKLERDLALNFLLRRSRDADFELSEGTFGVHLDYSLPAALRHRLRMLDPHADRHLTVRVGYRHVRSLSDTDQPVHENRPLVEITPRFALPWEVLVDFRNRFDFRWVNGDYSWRYRPRLKLRRGIALGGEFESVAPYAYVEPFYDSRGDDWARVRYAAGLEAALNSHFKLDVYYMRQDGLHPTRTDTNVLGMGFDFFF